MARKIISVPPDGDRAQKTELSAIIILPIKNILFLPLISASLPRGTRKTAEESRKAIATQLIPTAPRVNSSLMEGSAILIAAPRNGLIKEVRITTKRIRLREVLIRVSIIHTASK